VSKRIALTIVASLAAVGLAVQAATAGTKKPQKPASTHLLVGINDEANTLYGNTTPAFQTLTALRAQVLRVNLYWGGNQWAISRGAKPVDPTDPGDPAYNWAIYDRLVRYAHTFNIKIVFSILFTPGWANGNKGKNVAPTKAADLVNFSYAAAERYSGLWTPPPWQQDLSYGNGPTPLPRVDMWTAWNEPNNPNWLSPQYKRSGGKWVVASAVAYAKICNAVYEGVHSVPIPGANERVACGVTGPKGNNAPATKRASVDPMTFMLASKKAGLKTFDVYAHHPYSDVGDEPPTYVPSGKQARRIQLGNINVLINQMTKLWGRKPLWITEYGYQTNPPDKRYGVTWSKQALYMKQAYAIARKNPRIDMMLWFLVKDEPSLGGWQSGLQTVTGKKKPSWNTFRALPRG
jgi:hypothetical protein